VDFCSAPAEADAPTWACKIPRSSIEKLIPNHSILALTARACALQHYMSFIPKMKEVPESGFRF
jgi:hypothetical protein